METLATKRHMGAPRAGARSRLAKTVSKNKYLFLMIAPVLIYYIIFCYGPIYGAIIAFKDFDISKGILGSPWVGLKHFETFFFGPYFTRTLVNTLLISLYSILFGFPVPVIFALLLNELGSQKFKRVVQTVTYLPHFISMVVICGMIHTFVARNGIITDLYVALGGERANLLVDPKNFRTIFVVSGIWQTFGWSSIVYLSTLSNVDVQFYEAAELDGAGRFQKIWHITLPALIPTIVIMFIMRMGNVMTVGFEKVILLYNPNTYETADVISSYVYRMGLGESHQYSYSTAVGLFTSMVNFLLVVTFNFICKKVTANSLW